MKKFVFFTVLSLVVFLLGSNLWPGKYIFDFHDQTQPARIFEFVLNIKNNIIPPRMAPNFSFKLGYPVFNFYAPSAYWITAAINLFGFDIADSIKLSFLLALITAFIAMYKYLRIFFNFWPSLLGASLYVSSPYIAVDIFVRGNLGEVWFFALLPLSLYLLHKNASKKSPVIFAITAFILMLILTVHNIFSLLFLAIAVTYSLLLKKNKRNLLVIVTALFAASYFLIPAVLELKYTRAVEIARNTDFQNHFLCWWQIWKTTIWGYGGSVPGCELDGMSFKLGKIQLVLFAFGALILITKIFTNKHFYKNHKLHLYILIFTIASLFLSTYSSFWIWQKISFFSLFQFPWRFLLVALFGIAFFSAYLFTVTNYTILKLTIPLLVITTLIINNKYFQPPKKDKKLFLKNYLNQSYLNKEVVYKIPEYLPKQVDYKYWLNIDKNFDPQPAFSLDRKKIHISKNDYFEKKFKTMSQNFVINIHYFPYWRIYINNKRYSPSRFDKLARPIIKLQNRSLNKITLKYEETPLEKAANVLTVLTLLLLFLLLTNRKLWIKLSKHMN